MSGHTAGPSAGTVGDSLTVVKSGNLVKQARESQRNWKRRWFILNGNTLNYYADNKSLKSPKGNLLIVGEATISDLAPPDKEHKFPFKIVTPFEQITLCADSDLERMEWKIAFLKSIDLVQNSLRGYMLQISPGEPTIRKFFIFYHDTLSVHKDHECTITVQQHLTLSHHTMLEEFESLKKFSVSDRGVNITIQFETRTEKEYPIWVDAFRQIVQNYKAREQARLRAEEENEVNEILRKAIADRTIIALQKALDIARAKTVTGLAFEEATHLLMALTEEERLELARQRAMEEKRIIDLIFKAMELLSIDSLTSALNQAKQSNVKGEIVDQGHQFLLELIKEKKLKEEAEEAERKRVTTIKQNINHKLQRAIQNNNSDAIQEYLSEASDLFMDDDVVIQAQKHLNELMNIKAMQELEAKRMEEEASLVYELIKLSLDAKSIEGLRAALLQAQFKDVKGDYVDFAEKNLKELVDAQVAFEAQQRAAALKRLEEEKALVLNALRIAIGELSIDKLKLAISQAGTRNVMDSLVFQAQTLLEELLEKKAAEKRRMEEELLKLQKEKEFVLKLISTAMSVRSIDDLKASLLMASSKMVFGPEIDNANLFLDQLLREKAEEDARIASDLARLEAEKFEILERIRLAVEAFSILDLTAALEAAKLKKITGDYVEYGANYLDYLNEQENLRVQTERILELIRIAIEAISMPDLTFALDEARKHMITGEYVDYGQQYLDYLLQQQAAEEAERLHQLELEKFEIMEGIRLAIESNSIAKLETAILASIKFDTDEYVDYAKRFLVFLKEKALIEEEGKSVLNVGNVMSVKAKKSNKVNFDGATIIDILKINTKSGWKELYCALMRTDLIFASIGPDGRPDQVVDRGLIQSDSGVLPTTTTPFSFDVITSKRTFNLDSKSLEKRDAWIQAISQLSNREDQSDYLANSNDILYRDAVALIPFDTFYEVTVNSDKPLGIVLERAGEWASVKISNFKDTKIRIASIIDLIDTKSVMLENYQFTVDALMARGTSTKLKFRQFPEKFMALKVLQKGKWKTKGLKIGDGFLRIMNSEDPVGLKFSKEFPLLDAQVSLVPYEELGKRFCLKFTQGNQVLYIQAKNINEMREWGGMLFHAISIANGGAHIVALERERLAAEEARMKALDMQRISAENEDLVRMITKAIETKNIESIASLLIQAKARSLTGEFITYAEQFLIKLEEEKLALQLKNEELLHSTSGMSRMSTRISGVTKAISLSEATLTSMMMEELEEEKETEVEVQEEVEPEPEPEPEVKNDLYPAATEVDLAKFFSFYVKHTEYGSYINAMKFSTVWRLVTGVKGNLFNEMQTFKKFVGLNNNGTMNESDFVNGFIKLAQEMGNDNYLRRIKFLLGDDNMLM